MTAMSVTLGAAGTHGGERLVARGVEEGDGLAVVVDLVGADVLGDAAGLAGGDVGLADRVEQRRLAVVDVAHDRDDRRALDEVLVVVVVDRSPPRPRRRAWTISISLSNSSARTWIASSASVCVSVAISPSVISFLMTSGDRDAEVLGDVLDRRAGVDPDRRRSRVALTSSRQRSAACRASACDGGGDGGAAGGCGPPGRRAPGRRGRGGRPGSR